MIKTNVMLTTLSLACALSAQADFIKPIEVRTSSYYAMATTPLNLINGSGLSDETPLATHDNNDGAQAMWHAGNLNGGLGGPLGLPPVVSNQTIIFKLSTLQSFNVTNAFVWNMNQANNTGRGVSNMTISVSSEEDMLTVTNWVDQGTFTLNQASGTVDEPAQILSFAATNARLIRFVIHGTWNGTETDYVGLSEVRFGGVQGIRFEPEAQGVLPNPGIMAWANMYNDDYLPWNVFDSKTSQYCSIGQGAGTSTPTTPSYTTDTGNGTWLNFNFGEPVTIDRVVLATRPTQNDIVGASHFIFSNDATFDSSDTLVTITNTGFYGHSPIHSLGGKITAQYVRWEVGSSLGDYHNLGAQEIRFLNTPSRTEPITTGISISAVAEAFNGNYEAAFIINGDAGSGGDYIEFATNNQGINTFVDFDLGQITALSGFDYFDRLDPAKVKTFDLIFSRDSVFGNSDDVVRHYEKGALWTASESFNDITTRYVRFDVTELASEHPCVGGSEIIFYKTFFKATLIRFY